MDMTLLSISYSIWSVTMKLGYSIHENAFFLKRVVLSYKIFIKEWSLHLQS